MAPFTITIPPLSTRHVPNVLNSPHGSTDVFGMVRQPGNKENAPPSFVPSQAWLRNPSWIDGGVNPPRFYVSHAEIADVIQTAASAGINAPRVPAPPVAPTAVVSTADAQMLAPVDTAASGGASAAAAVTPTVASAIVPAAIQTPLDVAGHLISVTHIYSVPDKTVVARLAKNSALRKIKNTKFEYMVLEGGTRAGFIHSFFAVHDLADQYSPGVHSGPGFKLWWSGSSGGKAGAPTIENDRDFKVAIGALLQKNKKTCSVLVEFDTDTMDGFRIRQLVHGWNDPNQTAAEDELLYGTKVPSIDSFSEQAQLNGAIVMQLKDKWPCQQHSGEHGEIGYCYVTPNAEHIGLNSRKFKFWAAAIAANDATKHEPPNTTEFDSARDGRQASVRSRGRSGPQSSNFATSDTHNASALLMAAMLPILSNLSGKRARSPSPKPSIPRTPTCVRIMSPPSSPLPGPGSELRACLSAFAEVKGIDLTHCEDSLLILEFTPDIIPDVACARLCEVTGAVEGRIVKLQTFCKGWYARLEEKRTHLTEKRLRID